MAELISAAEGHSSDTSEDSDAERRIAYEAAQTRAGMDGLKKPRKDPAEELLKVPSKITPIPSLTECIGKLQVSLRAMEAELRGKEAQVQKLRDEGAHITKREAELQALLDETGKQYQEAMGKGKVQESAASHSGVGAELLGQRGLESMGTTPHRNGEDLDG
jgi:chromosome segregation ATPase